MVTQRVASGAAFGVTARGYSVRLITWKPN